MNSFTGTFFESLLQQVQQNAPSIILWLILFILILVLFVLYLARKITSESSKKAIEMARSSELKSEEIGNKIDQLNTYLQDVFRKEFGGAMASFDDTVSAVLQEMKQELAHSMNNIERIEASVKNRQKIDVQIEAGQDHTQALLTDNAPATKKKNA